MYSIENDRIYDYNNQFNLGYGNASLNANVELFGYFGNVEQDWDFYLMYDAGGEL